MQTTEAEQIQYSDLSLVQSSFGGGMRRDVDPSKLAENEYTLLINGRSRYETIMPIKKSVKQELGLRSSSNYQGCYGIGSIVIVFIDGLAWFRDYSDDGITSFTQVKGFSMSPTAEFMFAEPVPASTVNFLRIPVSATNRNTEVNLTSLTLGSPAALVVQDGVSQPQVIFPNGAARNTKTWEEWTLIDREYVPIGRQMLYINGILYVVSADGTQLYRSVSGRPLDFIIAVDINGNKLPNKNESIADALSHRVDYEVITAISRVNLNDGSFLVTTSRTSYLVTPDFNNLLYGEPQFSNTFLFPTGANNNFSIIDILGDTALIDFSGIRSFNAVLQFKYEGANSPFSSSIFPLFQDIVQANTCAINFDNYGLFAMDTIFGRVIVVYDTIKKKFTSIDINTELTSSIKQFSEIKVAGLRKLFFITDDGLYEAFVGTTATVSLFTKEICSNNPDIEQVPSSLRLVISDVKENGVLSVTPYFDRKAGRTITRNISGNLINDTIIVPPFGQSTKDTTINETFKFLESKACWKVGYWITWNFSADLSHFITRARPISAEVSVEQAASNYNVLST